MNPTFAFFAMIGPELAWPIAIGVVSLACLSIPILGILTNHRRRMAEIALERAGPINADEFDALRAEVRELRQLVQHQVILVDDQALALDNLVRRGGNAASGDSDASVVRASEA